MKVSKYIPILLARRRAAAGAVVPDGGLKSLTIADSTPIDENGSSIGIDGNGWVAIVVLKGLTSLVGTAAPSDLTLTVRDPGYDTSGNATTITRTITGVAHLRRQYPNGASKMISTDGTDLTLYITLDDWIYSGTTLVSASIGSSFYPSCVASSAGTKTNSSTRGYTKPVFGWINPQQERSGSTHAVEAVAFHRHATAGQQVACMKFRASDGTNNSAEVTVSTPTLSTRQTVGFIAEVFAGTLDFSGLTQAAMCTVNAKVYPWIGDSTAVLDLSSDGVAWPTSLPRTQLRVLCDRTGGYGGGYAYVKSGATGGAVSSVAATAKASPFPLLSDALSAMKDWNNVNKSHNDVGGGTIRLMDNGSGGAQLHIISAHCVNSPGSAWCIVERDPDTSAEVSLTTQATRLLTDCLRFRNITVIADAAGDDALTGWTNARGLISFDGVKFDNTQNKRMVSGFPMPHVMNSTLTGGNEINFNALPGTTANLMALIGVVSLSVNSRPPIGGLDPKLMIGCNMPSFSTRVDQSSTGDGDHGRITYNNRIDSGNWGNASAKTINYGFAVVQNLFETTGSIAFNAFADGDLTTVDNYIDMHNTSVGERASRMYNDVVASDITPSGLQKIGVSKFSIYDNFNWKGDTFSSGAGGTGTMAYSYSVGCVGNVSLFGTVSRLTTDAPHNDNADVPYMGNAWLSSSEYNCRRSGLGSPSQATVMGYFTSYTAAPQGVPARGGDYQPKNTSSVLKGRVPSGKSVLLKDIAGNTRKTDGTGAAGAYEAAA